MKVLLVEDNPSTIAEVTTALEKDDIEIIVARSQTLALDALSNGTTYDLIVCDLRIPTQDPDGEAMDEFGASVLAMVTRDHPGTPCIIFSAFMRLDNVGDFLTNAPQGDIYGNREEHPLVRRMEKDELRLFCETVLEIHAELRRLEDIEIPRERGTISLSREHERVLRLAARRLGGDVVRVRPLSGGRSGASVFRADVRLPDGSSARMVAKISSHSEIREELTRYQRHLAGILTEGTYAPLVDEIRYGAGAWGGVFYRLAETSEDTAFTWLATHADQGSALVSAIRELASPWHRNPPTVRRTVGDIRRKQVDDDRLATYATSLDALGWRDFERRTITYLETCQHQDLHGGNVLVKPTGQPLLIDYGDVGPGPSPMDPVTLELSLVFHPDSSAASSGWPTTDQCRAWANLDQFVAGCPFESFVRACRDWAFESANVGERVVYAVAYAYALRQLKYPGTDSLKALAIAEAAMATYSAL